MKGSLASVLFSQTPNISILKVNKSHMEIDKKYIREKIQSILDRVHQEPEKRRIRETEKSLEFACPICGDSEKNVRKKRGTLYLKNMMYICYHDRDNCSRSFMRLLSTFGIEVDPDHRMAIYDHVDRNVPVRGDDGPAGGTLDHLVDVSEFLEKVNEGRHRITNVGPVVRGSVVDHYLRDRKVTPSGNLLQGTYLLTEKWSQDVVIVLNQNRGKMLGFQLRNLKNGSGRFDSRMYRLYDYSALREIVPDGPMDEQEMLPYNKLSHFYGILGVDFDRTVTVFEGYFDSLFFPNAIGTTGVDTDLTFLLNNDSVRIRFFYDNDSAGKGKSVKMIDRGQSVFLWKKLFEDVSKKKRDRYEAEKFLSKIKDLNQLALLTKEPPYSKFDLEKYFSVDVLDRRFLV